MTALPGDEHLVIVTRAGQVWRAEIPELEAAQQARSLIRLHKWVRHRLGSGWINYQFHTGNGRLDRLVGEARQARRAAQLTDQEARLLTSQALAAAIEARLSVRDLAVLLAISYQRIQQLRAQGH